MNKLESLLQALVANTRKKAPFHWIIPQLIANNQTILAQNLNLKDDANHGQIYAALEQKPRMYHGQKSRIVDGSKIVANFNTDSEGMYLRFIKSVYPVRSNNNFGRADWLDGELKAVNHERLFHLYEALPEPRPLHMTPKTLDKFLEAFTRRRDFVDPVPLLNWKSKVNPKSFYNGYKNGIKKREIYTNCLSKILNDLKNTQIEIKPKEFKSLIFYSFFIDKPTIIKKVDQTSEQLNLPKITPTNDILTFEKYTELVKLVGPSTELYNTFLELAIRLENDEIIQDIEQKFNESMVPDRKTIGLLLKKVTTIDQLNNILSYLLTHIIPDNRTIDAIMMALCKLAPEKVEKFFVNFYDVNSNLISNVQENVENCEFDQYRALYDENDVELKETMTKYDSICEIIKSNQLGWVPPQGLCFPSENSFYHFIRNSKSIHYEKIFQLMDNYGIPKTTRMYKHCISNANNSKVLKKLIYSILEDYEKGTGDTKAKRDKILKTINDHTTLSHYLRHSPKEPEKYSPVKLSKDLITLIYKKLLECLSERCHYSIDLGYSKLKDNSEILYKQTESAKNETPKYLIDKQVSVMRKAYLIDMLELLESS